MSAASLDATRSLAERHGITNLEVHQLPIEDVAEHTSSFEAVILD